MKSVSEFRKWWDDKSGWSDGVGTPLLSEGKCAKAAWNAALVLALKRIVKDGNPEVASDNIAALISKDE